MRKLLCFLLFAVLSGPFLLDCYAAEDTVQVLTTPERAAKVIYQILEENKLLVSVLDADENPVRGLTTEDFVVKKGIKKAKILSAETLETSKEVPLNIVLVVDNSFSMKQRQAVDPLLSALEEFFKTVRPIDNIHAVVFAEKETMQVKQYTLHTKTFQSTEVSKLRDFFKHAFGPGITSGTYLYEAMVTGLDIIREMPKKDQKFLVVFSDGQDINSAFKSYVVDSEAKGISNLEAYSVDYMPRSKMDPFLKSFAEARGGRIWKAKSAAELLPIFQSFTTTLLHRYVVSYRFLDPPNGTLAMEPAELSFDMLTMIGGAPLMSTVFFETGKSEFSGNYVLFTDRAQVKTFDEKRLTTALDRYHNVLNLVGKKLTDNPSARVRIVGCNSDTGVEKNRVDLSEQRAAAARDYLSNVWGIDSSRMELEARNLPAYSTPMIVVGSRPENQRVEIIFDSREMREEAAQEFIVEANNTNEIKITPQIVAEYGLSSWELTILSDNQEVKSLKGTDDLKTSYSFSLNEFGRERLTEYSRLEARIRVADIYNDTHETAAVLPVKVSKKEVIHELVGPPHGSVTMEPKTLTIEELTTIDSSPLLNYVFFETGESDIPDRYTLLGSQAETRAFDQSNLKGTMEKYQHVLNIIAKRLVVNPEATIKIVGCNSNRGVELGRTDLSRGRAEAVRAYLRYIWGIDLSRMEVEARNLPAVASTGSVAEGRAENQRVEILSDFPGILDTVQSTYVEEITDAKEIRILPQIQAGYEIAYWTIELKGDGSVLKSVDGSGDLPPAHTFDVNEIGLRNLRTYSTIQAGVEVEDKKGQTLQSDATSSVRFIKREERVAQKLGYRVLEKYALILFDFDRADIKDRNKAVTDRIIDRIKTVPDAMVKIVGHTDTIGKEVYNVALSQRRAKAAYDQIMATGVAASDRVFHMGAGPYDPLYDNNLPEGRALNRTVTVTLEYEGKQ